MTTAVPTYKPETDQIHAAQTRLLYKSIPLALIFTLINAIILVAVQRGAVADQNLFLWLGLVIVILVFRATVSVAYQRSNSKQTASFHWARWFLFGTVLSGLSFGLAAVFLFPSEDIAHQSFLAFIIAGMCAAATSTLSYQRTPILAFLSLSLLPLALQFLVLEDTMSLSMGVMCLLFYIGVTSSALRMHKSTQQNIQLSIEATNREKALQESEERYRTIFESAPIGVVQYNDNGKIIACNSVMEKIIGARKKILLEMNILTDGLNDEMVRAVKQSLEGEMTNYRGSSDALWQGKNTPIRAFFKGTQSVGQHIIGGVGVFEDITENVRVEKMKNEFISTVSHELRTPLTAINGVLSLVNGGVVSLKSDKAVEILAIAKRNSDRLLLLINDLLEINKIGLSEIAFELQELEVMPFVHRVLQINSPYATEFGVRYEIAKCFDQVRVLADNNRLMQALSNLLSNAAKFSPRGSVINIYVEPVDNWVRIAIEDQGPGIEEEFKTKIFDKFTQSDSSNTRRNGGTGLGLSIAKAIIEKHKGQIGFTTEFGVGSTFYIDLPISTSKQ